MADLKPYAKGYMLKTRSSSQAGKEFFFNGEGSGVVNESSGRLRMMVGTYNVGDQVVICGLKKATMTQFNGTSGTISKADMAVDKYTVRCDLDN